MSSLIHPIPVDLYEKLINAQIATVEVNFSGGSDSAYLNVDICGPDQSTIRNISEREHRELCQEIEEWVWSKCRYSGAGDGLDYGDNIIYDLIEGTVLHEEWHHERVENILEEGVKLVVEGTSTKE